MSNFVREFVEIADHTSLDDVIDALTTLRHALPDGVQPEIRLRGDDICRNKIADQRRRTPAYHQWQGFGTEADARGICGALYALRATDCAGTKRYGR